MSTSNTYYLNGPTLATATAVFSDSNLTVCAPDGFYSDNTISREQVNCVLLPAQTCPSCASPCDSPIDADGDQGFYKASFQSGTDTGAMLIYFSPRGIPDGIKASLGTYSTSETTSPGHGYAAASSMNNFVYLGNPSNDCGIGTTLDAGGFTNLDEFVYQSGNVNDYVATGQTVNIQGSSADVVLLGSYSAVTNMATLVVPKTSNVDEILIVDVVGPCSGTAFDLQINCPAPLLPTPISIVATDCGTDEFPNTVYVAPNNTGTAGDPALNEFAFADENGVQKYSPGQYTINPASGKKFITIDGNGVITNFVNC